MKSDFCNSYLYLVTLPPSYSIPNMFNDTTVGSVRYWNLTVTNSNSHVNGSFFILRLVILLKYIELPSSSATIFDFDWVGSWNLYNLKEFQ